MGECQKGLEADLDELVQQIKASRIVPFLGAGISQQSGFCEDAWRAAMQPTAPLAPFDRYPPASDNFEPSVRFLKRELIKLCLEKEKEKEESSIALREHRCVSEQVNTIQWSRIKTNLAKDAEKRDVEKKNKANQECHRGQECLKVQWRRLLDRNNLQENDRGHLERKIVLNSFYDRGNIKSNAPQGPEDTRSKACTNRCDALFLDDFLNCLTDMLDFSFDQLAERYIWLSCSDDDCPHSEDNKLCEELHIHCYPGIQPSPAHYALAALTLERCISEVITTNWDCCLEIALDGLRPFEENRIHYRVVTTLENYCQPFHPDATLQIYKINGCSREFAVREKESEPHRICAAQRIVITERQLQSFGQKIWAKELVCDRVRSKQLLFSGFGSDEPQVRYTFLQVAGEANPLGGQSGEQIIRVLQANCPWVHVYRRPLSFNQQQVLEAFRPPKWAKAQSNFFPLRQRVLDQCTLQPWRDHWSQQPAPEFRPKPPKTEPGKASNKPKPVNTSTSNGNKLPADQLWCFLYDLTITQMVESDLDNCDGRFFTWLDQRVANSKEWMERILDYLCVRPPSREGTNKLTRIVRSGFFGPTFDPENESWQHHCEATNEYLRKQKFSPKINGFWLSQILWAARRIDRINYRTWQYCPYHDHRFDLLRIALALTVLQKIQIQANLNPSNTKDTSKADQDNAAHEETNQKPPKDSFGSKKTPAYPTGPSPWGWSLGLSLEQGSASREPTELYTQWFLSNKPIDGKIIDEKPDAWGEASIDRVFIHLDEPVDPQHQVQRQQVRFSGSSERSEQTFRVDGCSNISICEILQCVDRRLDATNDSGKKSNFESLSVSPAELLLDIRRFRFLDTSPLGTLR